ncbi:RNA polymerase sigma factor [Arthrobacter sp. W4I7]|uniref:RNA polymerase sigma factor n=1 Tax=Arthrobacter sp. W4I7 TaxID=3042296 RepID=UPI00278B41D3|nr:sigma-70 family RNA polymerase sigma factor [Arthrobacter sp. W4I7]MDQ0693206.1 RNA polymerase sigma factor (sigma-70 family) [Arthrobacter sp. W4I7]
MINDDASEVSLIDRARAGDARAFEELLRPHRDKLWAVCVRVTGHPADAEDAVQECMVAIWRGLPRFRGESQFSTWIYRIAANAALGIVRRRREVPVEEIFDLPPNPGFEDAIALHDEIQAALRKVPEDFRVALVLREYGGLTYEEIAEHQGIPIQTVKSRLNRARSAVRAALTVE